MAMPQSITNTAVSLNISKVKLYSMMRKHGIEATPSGNRKLIMDDQYEQLCELLKLEGRQPNLFNDTVGTDQSNSTSHQNLDSNNQYLKELLAEKSQQIERITSEKNDQVKWLTDQLESEKLERQNLQNGLMSLQGAMLKLDQRIALLQPSKNSDVDEIKNVKTDVPDFEEVVIEKDVPLEVTAKSSRNYISTTVWLVLLGVAVISAFELGGGSASELLRGWLVSN
jgi:hypothetical protein